MSQKNKQKFALLKSTIEIDAPGFAIYLGSLEMQFSQEKGYHYKSLTVEAIFDKQARCVKCGDVIAKNWLKLTAL